MPAKRIPMRKIKEILRLKYEAQLSHEKIARACGLSKGVIGKYVRLAEALGLGWPLPPGVDDAELERRLFPPRQVPSRFREPDYPAIHQELKRKGVTLQLLWSEYTAVDPASAYRYTAFCTHYRQWCARQRRSLRQVHLAGEKLFIDYCGPTVAVIDPATGELRPAQIFVAVLGASNYTYVEATWTQGLPDWIGAHVRAFSFFGGVPALLVPDNVRAGVSKACRYEPQLNPTYADLAQHYGTAVLPTRPYKPRDKAKVEVAVQVVERWVLARLRHHGFFSLGALNHAIGALREQLNDRPFKRLPGSRRSQFIALDRPALKPLPAQPYEYAEWKPVRVNIDYHVELHGHYYSVPHALVGQRVELRFTERTVEVLHRHQRVAVHVRSPRRGGYTTVAEHMPKSHQRHMSWTPGRFLNWAQDIGPHTRQLVDHLLKHRPHPEHGYRSCLGLLNLVKRVGPERLEAACRRALALGAPTRHSVASILDKGLDRLPLPESDDEVPAAPHPNVRGAHYYH